MIQHLLLAFPIRRRCTSPSTSETEEEEEGVGGAAELVQNQICSQQQMRSPPERRTNLYSPQSLLKILHHLFLHGEINNSAASHFTSQGATCVSQTGETGSSISNELQERSNQFTQPRMAGIKRGTLSQIGSQRPRSAAGSQLFSLWKCEHPFAKCQFLEPFRFLVAVIKAGRRHP